MHRFLGLSVLLFLLCLGSASADDKSAPKKPEYKGKPAARMIYYSGQVQGVGFRATAERIARDFPVTGWVKNLNDGRVQLLAEGPSDALEAFLKAVRTHWKDNIKKEQPEEQPVSGKYKEFKAMF
jgi:acylphosphatase